MLPLSLFSFHVPGTLPTGIFPETNRRKAYEGNARSGGKKVL